MTAKDPFFTPFEFSIDFNILPQQLMLMLGAEPHPLCKTAATQLQVHLHTQQEWQHNFGLTTDPTEIIGKMFGVLVVETLQNEIGYLAAFSGKLAGGNHHAKFVPPVYDLLSPDGFLNHGMQKLTELSQKIKELKENKTDQEQLNLLQVARKKHSVTLQKEIFEHYHFLNQAGEEKSLNEIFKTAGYKNPPAGAGECAGPKLLQYAFKHQMKPIALAEFWWGQSPKSATWKHGHFYACCKEKCEPILAHMLSGIGNKAE
ncbi:pseudouridylate synthase [Pedobacter sp. Hv1]|nr:pseudouridylate synthase [Pedobacter sp. Hv1]